MSKQAFAISELLRSIDKADACDHNIDGYVSAMKGFVRKATSVLAIGGDTVSLVLEDGNILKIGMRQLDAEMGTRPFDLPIFLRGVRKVRSFSHNFYYQYFVQPRAEPITDAQYAAFMKDVVRAGYWCSDPGKRNAGYYRDEDRIALIDPWAVEKMPAR